MIKDYRYSKQNKLKKRICDKCLKCAYKIGFKGCAFRNFDNECCGNLLTVIQAYRENKKIIKIKENKNDK